jgi:hypothetical protein
MVKHPRFLDVYHARLVPAAAIDDYIADWGDEDSPVALHVFLGMTWSEYQRWSLTGQLPSEAQHHRVPQSDVVFVGPDGIPLHVHGPIRCRPPCPIHWPSDHPQVTWPMGWDERQGIVTRLCAHGCAHPDPDDQQVRLHPDLADHDCDGCCRPTLDGEFFEEDEPLPRLLAAFNRAARGVTRRPT